MHHPFIDSTKNSKNILLSPKKPPPKIIPFSKLPLLIQERFAELCDTQTCEIFSKINEKTEWLSRNRTFVTNLWINDNNYIDFPENIEVLKTLKISMPEALTQAFVKQKIIKSYSKLIVEVVDEIDFEAFKHLIGPKVKECEIKFIIPQTMGIEEIKEKFKNLVNLLFSVKKIMLGIRCHNTAKIILNEVSMLSERPQKAICKYPDHNLRIMIFDTATHRVESIREPKEPQKSLLSKLLIQLCLPY